ncbi:salicylate hydroxylase [Aspergillus terreus]|uniref:Salicylate hydroxylase n=1 Tax=Aspergillus terreus TaxID=33178 RepID=A0A5M3YS14_ASPTE|nr:hypothetical protein ATETN484_0002065200 [Aspergillus terreus]GFF15508.1 salicylate hydroxylase [Aspergillus terreus]
MQSANLGNAFAKLGSPEFQRLVPHMPFAIRRPIVTWPNPYPASSCRQQGLDVIVLERAVQILPVGAGIVVPPNAGRAMEQICLLQKLRSQSIVVETQDFRRYDDGSLISRRHVGSQQEIETYGGEWLVVHRADYHRVLHDAATAAGVEVRLGASVKDIDLVNTTVTLDGGETLIADVIIGADGLWSTTRDKILGHPSPPFETGDLAYRATFPASQLRALGDPDLNALLDSRGTNAWWGPDKHCVLYPVRGGSVYNLVLLRPDDLPARTDKALGDLHEMAETFKGWDSSCIPHVLKWKLCHHEELETWCQNNTAIIGDACHPTLPYQAQGAAMAVEDGVVVAYLIGQLVHDFSPAMARAKVPSILKLYERMRKPRTTLNVQGAVANRKMNHLHDGAEQQQRDKDLNGADYLSSNPWKCADGPYQKQLLAFDTMRVCREEYDAWKRAQDA